MPDRLPDPWPDPAWPERSWHGTALPAMRLEAPHADRVLPCFVARPPSVHAMLAASVARSPQAEALVDGERRWRYEQLDADCARLAAGLAAAGLVRGERVLMFIDNCAEFVLVWLALQRLGVITVPVGVREQRPGLAYIARQCGAAAVVADAGLVPRLPDATEAPALRLRISVGPAAGCLPLATLLACGDAAPDPATPAETDVAVILYTSGTTGQPKGATITHLNIAHSVLHYQLCMRLRPGERSALAVPASHVTGLIAIIASMLQVGGAIVVVPAFKAGPFVALLQAERITHTLMVPAMYQLCLLHELFAHADLSAWRVGGYGGAPMPVATIDALAASLPGLMLLNCYGATETTSPTTMIPWGATRAHADSVGVALPAAQVAVMDEQGRELPRGETGELWIAGPMVVPGYWANPEATAASFSAGWWHSGDLGSVDAQGYVRVFDRKKDMLNRGGFKIYSVEVENVLMAWPGVAEAAIVGRPCPVLGERVHAFVHMAAGHPGGEAHSQALRAFCAERLADYKVPEAIHWREAPLPRNANGKLMKRLLREQLG
ncbi:class I adenylate-forming enzyme family protein [Aquabacterium sp. OR-4]|uniref:class I adenylate-forming enzyme family protein n=1 Tax=Aquabacterium sp. OR-4 TaxID=2978127 RepID=UPI0028C80459|nr:class I adenylate-forming enzyme family protein [Aquabacterium sp. OR-4]MDT7835580.1 class I adenylate-forming enzyme family protein [Aquabacterium sp. OR-4]